MPGVQATGTISYFGITFGVMTETQGITSRPIYDTAGRTVVYVVHSITIKTYIQADAGIDTTLEELRKRLLRPGGEFRYEDKGFGALVINVGGIKERRDVVWGPKPQLLSWKPKGDNKAAEIVWMVEVAIPECDGARYAFGVMEFNYRLGFSVDQKGYTTRTYSGHLRIPQTRKTAGNRNLLDNADSYRERVVPSMPPGFRRTTRQWDVSEDKCKLIFTIVDEQMPPNIPPPGVILAEASHRIRSTGKAPVAKWAGVISASYEVGRGVTVSLAAVLGSFFALFKDRTRQVINVPGDDWIALRTSLDISEPEIYGHTKVEITAGYSLTVPIQYLLQASGLWRPVPNNSWQQWKQSLASVLGPRGHADLKLLSTDDALIDLCQTSPVRLPVQTVPSRGLPPVASAQLFANDYPSPAASWLDYRSSLSVEPQDQAVILKPLPKTELIPKPPSSSQSVLVGSSGQVGGSNSTGGSGQLGGTITSVNVGNSENPILPPGGRAAGSITNFSSPPPADIVQYRAGGTTFIVLEGAAQRAGYAIAAPVLLSVGGKPALPFKRPGDSFRSRTVANWLGLPIVAASWRLTYVLAEPPRNLTPRLG